MGLQSGVIDVVGRAMSQYRTSVDHLRAITQAKRKLKQDEEDRSFEKKKRELELEDLQRKGELSELQFDILKSQNQVYTKQQEQIAKGKQVTIKQAEHKEKTLADQALNFTQSVFRNNPKLAQDFLETVRFPGETRGDEIEPTISYGRLGFKRSKPAQEKEQKTVSTFESILAKVANNQPISEGEQKIYDAKMTKPLKSTSTTERIKEQVAAKGIESLSENDKRYHDLYIKSPKAKKEVTGKEINDEARSMAKADGDETKWREYIEEAKYALTDERPPKPLVDASGKETAELGITGSGMVPPRKTLNPKDNLTFGQKVLTSGVASAITRENKPKPISKTAEPPKFKTGDIRIKDGIKYKRGADGKWLPLR